MKLKIILILALSCSVFAQSNREKQALQLLDSVKSIYGNPCEIGVESSLIKRLMKFDDIYVVKDYLKQYEKLSGLINEIRQKNLNKIKNDNFTVINFKNFYGREKNLLNACGVYYGINGVNNLTLSYSIARNSFNNYYAEGFQFQNFDLTFKLELIDYGLDWFLSKKLMELNDCPLNN